MEIKDFVPILLAIIATLVSVGGLVRQYLRDKADVATVYEQMATRQAKQIKDQADEIDAMNCKIDVLEEEVKGLNTFISELLAGITLLTSQLTVNHIEPVWKPRPRAKKETSFTQGDENKNDKKTRDSKSSP